MYNLQNKPQYITQDSVDLRELFSTLKRRQKMIWSVTFLLTLIALVYVFVAKPVYEVKAMIEVGKINDKPIDDIINIQKKLLYEYKVDAKGIKIELPRVKGISVPKKSNSILSLVIHGNNNDEAQEYIHTVISKITTQYQEKTAAYTSNQKELIKLTQEDIQSNLENLTHMKKELDDYNKKIISLKREDAALAGIYALQIGQQQTQLQALKKDISKQKEKEQDLKLSITPLMMKPTNIVGEIETLDDAVKPKKKLIVIVAFFTGLILSVFLAFFLEFISRIKKEETQS